MGEAGRALRDGSLSAQALIAAHLHRIDARDGDIGAFVHVARQEALAAAARVDRALAEGAEIGPLHGLPFAVKDLIDVAGWPVRHGSRRHADRIAADTAPAVARLIAAGAIPLGLVATYEFATVGPDRTSLYRQPRNPWNRAHVTGGSSSGAAAAIAAGLVRFALGTDTGGSIRSPAAFCGVCGLKPERGLVPMGGVQPLAPTLDTLGPMATSVGELAMVYQVLADRPGAAMATGDLAGLRIGYARSWAETAGAATSPLLGLLDDAASVLSLSGAEIALIELPDYQPLADCAAHILQAEQSATHAALIRDGGAQVGRMAHESLLWGYPLDPARLDRAREAAKTATAEMEAALAGHDAVILPTTLAPAPPFAAFDSGRAVWTDMRTLPFNLTGHAALSVPMGFQDGLPMGLQITGAFGRTETILRVGAAFEAATDRAVLTPYPA